MQTIKDAVVTRVSGAAAAAQTTVTSAGINTRKADSVLFLVTLATIASGGVVLITAEGRHTSTGSWETLNATLAHTATGAETGVVMGLEVQYPAQWAEMRVNVARSTANSAIENVTALKRETGQLPATQPTGVYLQTVGSPLAA